MPILLAHVLKQCAGSGCGRVASTARDLVRCPLAPATGVKDGREAAG